MQHEWGAADVRWLTYPEAAELLGIELKSVQRRVVRAGWDRRKGNDGRQRIAVPLVALERKGDRSPDVGPPSTATEAHLSDLRTALAARERELVELRTQAAEVRERLARSEGELDGVKLGMEHLQEAAAQARREATEAQRQAVAAMAAVEAEKRARREVEAALARLRGRGMLARLLNRG
jgi:hypothetical protein